ncbi:MAG: hypothetical protein JRC68_04390 [Deltaproteobacteria bacterium]|nr:hypothetical protein [Deltaproteobacteria bacterium]
MTHEDREHYAKKHPPDRKVNTDIDKAVRDRTSNNEISCAAAFGIVNDLNTSPDEVGFTVDSLEVTITKCQLGLFGYGKGKKVIKPAETMAKDLEQAIVESLADERLTCKTAWEISERFGIKKMEVASDCEALQVKIYSCQLGAF